MSLGEICRSGMCNPIRMDISSMRHLGHSRLVRRSVENDPRKLFASYFLRKDENPLPRRRSSKYGAVQESRTGTPESSDVIIGCVLKLHAMERRTDTGRDERVGVLQCRSPPDLKREGTRREGIPGRRVRIQTQGFSKIYQSYRQAPTPTRQKHRCLTGRTRYYSFRYSTICYRISIFFMLSL